LFKSLIVALLLCFVAGCDESDIEYYEINKKPHNNSIEEEPHNHSPYAWDIPMGWKQKIGGQMRIVSFSVEGKDLDVSIVQLGGKAGGLVANINRWRDQIGLKAASEEEIKKSIKKDKSAVGEFSYTVLSNKKESILASIYDLPGVTLFVKAKASNSVVLEEKVNFLSLCRSLRVNDHKH
jgi:hypothetical protein